MYTIYYQKLSLAKKRARELENEKQSQRKTVFHFLQMIIEIQEHDSKLIRLYPNFCTTQSRAQLLGFLMMHFYLSHRLQLRTDRLSLRHAFFIPLHIFSLLEVSFDEI